MARVLKTSVVLRTSVVLKTIIFVILLTIFLALIGCSIKNVDTKSESKTEQPAVLTVSAAASLKDSLEEILVLYKSEKPDVDITFNFGSSGSLQQQIEQGAPVDVYISASSKHMKALEQKSLIIPETKKILVKNKVVLIAPGNSANVTGFDSLTKDGIKRVALGEPESVPAGKYGKEILTSLKIWDKLQSKFVFAKDVRQVLSWVEYANADAGIVYLTDAKVSDKVKIVTTASEETHSPVVYPLAVLKGSREPKASKDFSEFLFSEKAKQVFTKNGFTVSEK